MMSRQQTAFACEYFTVGNDGRAYSPTQLRCKHTRKHQYTMLSVR